MFQSLFYSVADTRERQSSSSCPTSAVRRNLQGEDEGWFRQKELLMGHGPGAAVFIFHRGHLQPLRCSMIGLVSGQDLSSAMMANSSSSPPTAALSVSLTHSREW